MNTKYVLANGYQPIRDNTVAQSAAGLEVFNGWSLRSNGCVFYLSAAEAFCRFFTTSRDNLNPTPPIILLNTPL
jgi:hypothetical protein